MRVSQSAVRCDRPSQTRWRRGGSGSSLCWKKNKMTRRVRLKSSSPDHEEQNCVQTLHPRLFNLIYTSWAKKCLFEIRKKSQIWLYLTWQEVFSCSAYLTKTKNVIYMYIHTHINMSFYHHLTGLHWQRCDGQAGLCIQTHTEESNERLPEVINSES